MAHPCMACTAMIHAWERLDLAEGAGQRPGSQLQSSLQRCALAAEGDSSGGGGRAGGGYEPVQPGVLLQQHRAWVVELTSTSTTSHEQLHTTALWLRLGRVKCVQRRHSWANQQPVDLLIAPPALAVPRVCDGACRASCS